MKTTEIKSIVTLAMLSLVLSFGSNAFADYILDCGVVKCSRAGYTTLSNILAGKRAPESERIHPPIELTVNIGPVEMRKLTSQTCRGWSTAMVTLSMHSKPGTKPAIIRPQVQAGWHYSTLKASPPVPGSLQLLPTAKQPGIISRKYRR